MASAGIDYGMGQTNIDPATGIRYGVIHANDLAYWHEESEADYGDPTCPDCGNVATSMADVDGPTEDADWFVGRDYCCLDCKECFWSDSAFGDEPLSHTFTDADYDATQGSNDHDVFVTRSPFYTFAPFCSPCAPGAGYLDTDGDPESGVKTYCFGHDWFEDGKAPYRVYRVADDVEVFADV